LTPKHFQPDGARFMLERNRSYLAADAGTGKTIMAALAINASGRRAVYFCPPFLAVNTRIMLSAWNTHDARVAIYGGDDRIDHHVKEADILIVPDSLIADPLGARLDLWDRAGEMARSGAMAFVDEAHRYKTIDSQRTESLTGEWGLLRGFERIAFMSGTPIPNGKPKELYPIISRFAPETINYRSYNSFGMHYCAGFYDGWGYDFEGRSNVPELFGNLRRTFMLRIKKADVLKELTPRTSELVILADDLPAQAAKLDRQMLSKYSSHEDLAKRTIAPDSPEATYLRLLGHAKAPLAVAFIKGELAETDESALVFARHIDVVALLAKGLAKYKPLVITGQTPKAVRQKLVDAFQSKREHRVFIGNVDACGVGFTLTKATRVFHVEPSWVPGVNSQAADRADRIGQEFAVHEQFLVFKNSRDRAILESNLRKSATSDQL
jgi:SNF2 family DNA or RNA helicase